VSERIAVLGLGAMGLAMSRRLASGMEVTGFDPDPGRTALARGAGLTVAASPAEAADGARFVLLAVRTQEHAETCLFGDGGATAALGSEAVVLLTSTVGVAGARSIGRRLSGRFLDLPVSGGPTRAEEGTLLVLAGGDAALLERARPVLDLLAGTLVTVGPDPGDGQAMKTVNQLLAGVHLAAAAEALALARGLGLDPAAALEALGAGAAASFMLANRGPRIVKALAGSEPDVLSRIDIFVKDLGIVREAASAAGVELPVAAAAEALYRRAEEAGGGARDDSTVLISGSNIERGIESV
jgi:3-hydroxyisobutyrate dehydrogenase